MKWLLSTVTEYTNDAGPAHECLQQLQTALQEAVTTLGRLPQQTDTEQMAARLRSSLHRVSAMQASLHASLEKSSAGRCEQTFRHNVVHDG